MSEYWKSTPKYWCKHCSIYVRDTKFERQNHEATAKHQGALKRFLRDLHRNHEQDQREKERAKREVERLNGVVNSTSTSTSTANVATTSKTSATGRIPAPSQLRADGSQRQKQWEQLAEMGIDVPTELRRDMAMAGEWTVTNTRVIKDTSNTDDPDAKPDNVDAVATGVRKRPKLEEEEEEEENAIKSLFKKPRKWGRDTKHAPENDAELDALLNGTLIKPSKTEGGPDDVPKKEEDLPNIKEEHLPLDIKKEIDEDSSLSNTKPTTIGFVASAPVKQEESTEGEAPTVIFKKRKPKNIRQR